ncbi:MAG: flagellar basal body rod protein FlgB [Pseudomonadota bacterium]
MNLLKSSLLSGLADRLNFLASRSGVIAENIANADTPNYIARDVQKPEFKKLATQAMRVSDARHIASPRKTGAARVISAPDGDAALNGNQVSLESQMMKLSETRMNYQLASTVYRKGLDMMRIAVRGGGR